MHAHYLVILGAAMVDRPYLALWIAISFAFFSAMSLKAMERSS